MITDLAAQADATRMVETDFLIIGAGIAGLILASRLRRQNRRIIILESGGLEQATSTHPLNRVIQLSDAYSGATHGRFRCLGGTSTRWGGALIPFLENDLSPRPYLGLPAFPVGMDAIRPYLVAVEKFFSIDEGSYEEAFVQEIGATEHIPVGDPDFHARFAKWPTFKRRNVGTVLNEMIRADSAIEVSLNSTATEFNLNGDNGLIQSVNARHESGRSITVAAKYVIICAGAIETTRLLLLLDRQYNQRVFQGGEALGRYFYDHISAPVASIHAADVTKLNRMAAFRFVGSTMRSLRFELSPEAQRVERVGSAFGHISFKTERETGFDMLRQLLRSRQRGRSIDPTLLLAALRDIPYLAQIGFWRVVRNQLLWPVPATYELHVVAEQLPRRENSIALSSEMDAFGLPLAAIDWRVKPEDLTTFAVFKRLFEQFWTRRGLRAVGELIWASNSNSNFIDRSMQADVYHPGGSTRMGFDRRSAVLDSDLGVFGVNNLWAASTAAFPSGGGANPTLTLMLFTMRLADHLARVADADYVRR